MSILWCGGEDADFPNGALAYTDTNNSYRRTSYSRCAVKMSSANTVLKSTLFAAVTSCWLTFRLNNSYTGVRAGLLGLGRSGTNSGLFVGQAASSPYTKLTLYKYDGTTFTSLATESGTSLTAVVHRIDMQVINYGVSATVNVYLDGALLITYTGDVTVSGVTDLDSVYITGSNVGGIYASEIIVADEDTRTMSLATLAPSAAGDANAWTGAYTDINETQINDADEMYVNVVGQDAQLNLADLPAGAFVVKAVGISARVAKSSGATANSINLGLKIGGTISPGANQACTTGWTTITQMFATNPVTATGWQLSDVNALQLNLRSGA